MRYTLVVHRKGKDIALHETDYWNDVVSRCGDNYDYYVIVDGKYKMPIKSMGRWNTKTGLAPINIQKAVVLYANTK